LKSPNWDVKFHVHTNASLLLVGAMLAQNLIGKHDQHVVYAFKLPNNAKINYSTIEREALGIVFVLHKFKNYLLGNKFVFYVDHMALVYLVNKRQIYGRIAKWLLLFLKYEFTVIYKLGRTHVVADALSMFLDTTKLIRVFDQTTYVALFMLQPIWLEKVKDYLQMR
jgi:hypothetical protein